MKYIFYIKYKEIKNRGKQTLGVYNQEAIIGFPKYFSGTQPRNMVTPFAPWLLSLWKECNHIIKKREPFLPVGLLLLTACWASLWFSQLTRAVGIEDNVMTYTHSCNQDRATNTLPFLFFSSERITTIRNEKKAYTWRIRIMWASRPLNTSASTLPDGVTVTKYRR